MKELKSIKFPGLEDVYKIPEGGGGGGTVTEADIENALGYKPIGADDVPVKSVNGQTGETKTNWYFNVTGSVASPATTQTAAQIVAAQTAGFAPICKAVLSEFNELPATLPALLVSSMMCVFGGIGTVDGTASYISVMINSFGTLEVTTGDVASKDDIPTIPTELKNPHPLNIKIGNATTIYDGSAEQTVEIPDGGGTNESLGISGASVGQAALVKSVDETGKPIEWEPAALAKADGSNIPSSADIKAKWRSTLQTLPGIILYGKDSDGKILVYTDAACTQAATYLVGMDIADLKNALFVYNHNTYQCVGLQEVAGMPGTYAIPVFARTEVLKTEVIVESIVCDVMGFLGGSVSAPAILSKQIYTRQTLPNVTTADNGKILRVVNGAWAAIEIANANGGSF